MKAVEGISLKEIVEESQQSRIAEVRAEITTKIKALLLALVQNESKIQEAKKQIERAEANSVKIRTRLDKIRAGDWSALGEDKNET